MVHLIALGDWTDVSILENMFFRELVHLNGLHMTIIIGCNTCFVDFGSSCLGLWELIL